jgi:phage terminase Nu1 subunit (DNA packaging protein)
MNTQDNALGLPPVTILSEDLDKHLTTAELSEIIAIPVRTIEGWRIRGGGPPFTKVGPRNVRYDLHLVRAWLRENTRSVTA